MWRSWRRPASSSAACARRRFDASATLANGDAIVFYTDGVIEAEGWSSERLQQCVARGGTAGEIAQNITSELPKENEDDVTLVVVRI